MLILNGNLITWENPNQILQGQAVYIENGKVEAIGPQAELLTLHPRAEQLDANGQYVMPGNICAHTHFYGAFARGMAINGTAPRDFLDILQKLWWPLDQALTKQDVKASAMVMLAEAIKHGTTTLIDHHASPNALEGSLDWIAEAVEESGLRAVLSYEVTDRYGEAKTRASIDENVRFIKRCKDKGFAGGRVKAAFGLHASLTLSDSTLDACCEAAPQGSSFHIHAAESDIDQYDSMEKYGLRVVDRLYRHGILNARSIAAHAVHVDTREINLLAESGTWVTHQPRSNMNNGVGVAPVESMLRSNVALCMGTDGFTSTMWEEWKHAYLIQKVWHRDPRRMPGDDIINIAVYNNASLAGVFFQEGQLGIIRPGAMADLIFVDYHPHTELTPANLPWHILFGFHESMVTTMIVDGKIIMQQHQLKTLDEAAIAAHARELAPAVWERYNRQFR